LVKYLFLLSLIFVISCNNSTSVLGQLSPGELANIQARASAACIANNTPAYNEYKRQSDLAFVANNFQRNYGYNVSYSDGSSTSTVDYRVFYQDLNNKELYFYVTAPGSGTGTNVTYFLRATAVQNDAIITQLLADSCNQTYTTSSVGSSGPVSIINHYSLPNTIGSFIYNDTYVLPFNFPAIFARFYLTRTKTPVDAGGVTNGPVINVTPTFSQSTYTGALLASYTLYPAANIKFCEVTVNASPASYQFVQGDFGFATMNCVATKPTDGTWDSLP
jgi:hypothetical protein